MEQQISQGSNFDALNGLPKRPKSIRVNDVSPYGPPPPPPPLPDENHVPTNASNQQLVQLQQVDGQLLTRLAALESLISRQAQEIEYLRSRVAEQDNRKDPPTQGHTPERGNAGTLDVLLKVVSLETESSLLGYTYKQIYSGQGGILCPRDVPTCRFPSTATVADLQEYMGSDERAALSFCSWGTRPDGALRPLLPWRDILPTTKRETLLAAWLGDWLLQAAEFSDDGLPIVILSWVGFEYTGDDDIDEREQTFYSKRYLPHLNMVTFGSFWPVSRDPKEVLEWLREKAGLPKDGPPEDIMIWIEGGPNNSPSWIERNMDFASTKLDGLGLAHGDIIVVQEHPNRLPTGLPFPRTAPEWFQQRAEEWGSRGSGGQIL